MGSHRVLAVRRRTPAGGRPLAGVPPRRPSVGRTAPGRAIRRPGAGPGRTRPLVAGAGGVRGGGAARRGDGGISGRDGESGGGMGPERLGGCRRSSDRRAGAPARPLRRGRGPLGGRGSRRPVCGHSRTFDPDVIDAWFRLGFGQQHVHALRESGGDPVAVDPRRVSRSGGPASDDVGISGRARPCSFPATRQRRRSSRRVRSRPSKKRGLIGRSRSTTPPTGLSWPSREGQVVGSAVGAPVRLSSIHRGLARPDHAAILGFAAVFPAGSG